MARSWIFEYVQSGFHGDIGDAGVRWFRIGLAVAVILQWWFDLGDNGWHYLDHNNFVGFSYNRTFKRIRYQERIYHFFFCLKLVAGVVLLSGYLPQYACWALAASLLFQWSFQPLNTTTLMALAALMSATIGSYDTGYVLPGRSGLRNEPFTVLLIVALYWQMYWASAWRKIRSRAFMSGDVLHRMFEHAYNLQGTTRVRQTWYPRRFVALMIEPDHQTSSRRWRPAAVTTVAIESALPLGLSIPAVWPYAVAAGCLMHLTFTVYLPRKILPFTVTAVAGFCLFNPTLSSWCG